MDLAEKIATTIGFVLLMAFIWWLCSPFLTALALLVF